MDASNNKTTALNHHVGSRHSYDGLCAHITNPDLLKAFILFHGDIGDFAGLGASNLVYAPNIKDLTLFSKKGSMSEDMMTMIFVNLPRIKQLDSLTIEMGLVSDDQMLRLVEYLSAYYQKRGPYYAIKKLTIVYKGVSGFDMKKFVILLEKVSNELIFKTSA